MYVCCFVNKTTDHLSSFGYCEITIYSLLFQLWIFLIVDARDYVHPGYLILLAHLGKCIIYTCVEKLQTVGRYEIKHTFLEITFLSWKCSWWIFQEWKMFFVHWDTCVLERLFNVVMFCVLPNWPDSKYLMGFGIELEQIRPHYQLVT